MTQFAYTSSHRKWIGVFSLAALFAGCGSKDPVLGGDTANPLAPPQVVATSPTEDVMVVPVHNPVITATFNQPVAFETAARFTLSCMTPCINPTGAAQLDASGQTISFTPTANLTPYTLYTATISGAKGRSSQIAMQAPHVWQFTTGVAPVALSVTAASPVANTAAVATNIIAVSAYFSEAIAPLWAASSSLPADAARFALTCAAPCVSPTGSASLDDSKMVAHYWLTSGTVLAPLTRYTATISDTRSQNTGAQLAEPFSWQFTTGNTADQTHPSVTATLPATERPGPAQNVPSNRAISATFSEALAPSSVTAASFRLTCEAPCTPPGGSLAYVGGTRTIVFTPSAALADNTTYTATLTTALADLTGNGLADDYQWMFTTSGASPIEAIKVVATTPVNAAQNACLDAAINARFELPLGAKINPTSINSRTFILTTAAPALTPLDASVIGLDTATGSIASFKPRLPLVEGTRYIATLKGGANGVQDLAVPANTMDDDYAFNFTADTCASKAVINLGSAGVFAVFGGTAGITNQGVDTRINGDLGAEAAATLVTGFHDGGPGCIYTETPLNTGAVNGGIFTAAPAPTVACPTEGTAQTAAIAAAARADSLIAYNTLVAQAAGPDPGAGNLANLVLAPGVYTAAAGTFIIQGGDLTLDAQGDTDAVWIFQMASSFTVGGPGASAPQSITLVNGAQAKNIYWQVGSAATINAGGGGIMAGSLISQAGTSISTAGNTTPVTVNGRVLSLNGAVTLVNTHINVPPQ